MSTQQIACPHCNELISIDQVLSHQIEDSLRREFMQKQKKQEEAFLSKQQQQEREFTARQQQLEEANNALARQQSDLKRQTAELTRLKAQAQNEIEERVAQQIAAEKTSLMKEAREKAKMEAERDQLEKTALLEEQLRMKEERLKEATAKEIELLKEKSRLQEEKERFEVEKLRQLDEAKQAIQEEAKRRAVEEQHFIIAQLNKKLEDATKAKDELARKLEQGSQQTQGEVLELELEAMLMVEYPHDEIKPVPKGVYGADVIHTIITRTGLRCGTIVWESKKTKAWSEGWVQKLKDDQRAIKADVSVLVSTVLPGGMTGFGFYNGIWVCEMKFAAALSVALRHNLEAIQRERSMSEGKNEKMEMVYAYLTGIEFRQRVEAIVEAFTSMSDDLRKERLLFEKNWAKRERQLMKVMQNTVGMYGDLSGMVTLQNIKSLEPNEEEESLPKLSDGQDEDSQSTLL